MVYRTRNYFQTVKSYGEKLAAVWAEYEAGMQGIDAYKGSSGYESDAGELERTRLEATRAAQREYTTRFRGIISGMRMSAKNRSMETPTTGQVNLLAVLKMRERITGDELEQAGRTLRDCPACLSVLEEIAAKMDLHGLHFAAESTTGIMQHIDALEDAARRICAQDRPDGQTDIETEAEAMTTFGGVDDFGTFAQAVNG